MYQKDELIEFKKEFCLECFDLLDTLEDRFLKIENMIFSKEDIDLIFRILHTIKGSSSSLLLKQLSKLTHDLESYYDDIRQKNYVNDHLNLDKSFDYIDLAKKSLNFLISNNYEKELDHGFITESSSEKIISFGFFEDDEISPKQEKVIVLEEKKVFLNKNIENKKILIIDDDIDILDLEKESILEIDSEVEIFLAENGKKGLEILEKEHIDLILLDLNMPILNGFEFAKIFAKLKKEKKTNALLIIFSGMQPSHEKYLSLIECGLFGFLTKPLKQENLSQLYWSAVKEILTKKEIDNILSMNKMCYLYLNKIDNSVKEEDKSLLRQKLREFILTAQQSQEKIESLDFLHQKSLKN